MGVSLEEAVKLLSVSTVGIERDVEGGSIEANVKFSPSIGIDGHYYVIRTCYSLSLELGRNAKEDEERERW